ncbi:myosin light chain kinase [Stylonychia lemnae]|uniref:Myosin light chain kinase n=1 Tax=Stylonychia lemnae TaxID=5949 RepID=A0A078B663_STYLE|nr:myosin light chain kinase [Stylonychia lemnae]|eukprot:CDW90010.1 myosin light chain kinase [Stylonychia lemnae]
MDKISPELENFPQFNEQEDKIFLKDFELEQNEHFIKFVFIPYFKDIYLDLFTKSDKAGKGINKIVFQEYANLPGLLGERLFKIIDENGDQFLDQKEFIHAMFKIYYSKLESKIKLVFDITTKVDHFPKVKKRACLHKKEVEELTKNFLLRCFYQQIIHSTKDNLQIMSVLQDCLPCSDNFFRFQGNYDKFMQKKARETNSPISYSPPRQLASPKQIGRLSPINNLLNKEQQMRKQMLNIDTQAQQNLLRYAANKDHIDKLKEMRVNEDEIIEANIKAKNEQIEQQLIDQMQLSLTLEDKDNTINSIPISKFKPNQIQMMEGKLCKQQSIQDKEESKSEPKSPVHFREAIRLPNIGTLKSKLEEGYDNKLQTENEAINSPTNFLSKQNQGSSPQSNQIVFDNFMSSTKLEEYDQYEGEILRKAPGGKYKRYWFCLLGKELYCYKKKNEEKHKGMHSLVGAFIKEDEPELLPDGQNYIYPFRIIFPPNKSRTYYLLVKSERDSWLKVIKAAIGYAVIEDFYEIKQDLGRGKFGQVKLAIHKKTQKKVAVKVIKKKDMSLGEVELQKREIEVLKICQHPNIIRLLDVFENPDYIYIVLEHMAGGDLFNYLERREFKITEDKARNLTHQIASALYYLHSYGIVHRDIKLENILMVDQSNDSELKLVDFGLSKILGPNETTNDPFGTLSYVAPEVLLQRPYAKSVDLWSLGVIIYILLSAMLPFDADDQKEAARRIIYEPVPFTHPIWDFVTVEAKDLIARLLDKDRYKRITLDEVLTHQWVCKRNMDIQEMRRKSGDLEKFVLYTNANLDKNTLQNQQNSAAIQSTSNNMNP